MQKTILVLAFIGLASCSLLSAPTTIAVQNINDEYDSTEDFLIGMATPLGLQTAAEALIACVATIPSNLLSDLGQMIDDIQSNNWTGVVTEGIAVLTDIQELQSECPDGADPFVTEFQPLIDEWNNNSQQVINTITSNCENNVFEVGADIVNIVNAFNANNPTEAGEGFGDILKIALKGIINT